MNKKILVTFSVIAIYATLLGLFLKLYRESTVCYNHNSSCIRFCSEDTENYSNEFLVKELRKRKSHSDLDKDLRIYRGSPTCGGVSFLPAKYNETSNYSPYNIQSVSL